MKTRTFLKFMLIISSLSLHFSLRAQKYMENMTNNFGQWHIDKELVILSNSLQQLDVKNVDAVSDANKKSNSIDYHQVVLNLNWKENSDFYSISFNLLNKQADPYSFKYKVYEKKKNGELKDKWHDGNIYWGMYLELYGLNGSIVHNTVWYCVQKGNFRTEYSENVNDKGWEDRYLKYTAPDEKVVIFKSGNEFSFLAGERVIGKWANIAGIKNLKIMVGSAAQVSVTNLIIQRGRETNTSSNSQIQQSAPLSTAKEYFEKGEVYFEQEDYAQAIICWQKVVSLNSDLKKEAYYSIGMSYTLIEDYNSAIIYFQKEIDRDPNNIDPYIIIGNALENKADYTMAINY
jgi:tetratricopeptide (TPR) repeat protein